MRTTVLLVLAILTCACQSPQISYPPPEQRHFADAPSPVIRASPMVYMNDEDAPLHFVRDISANLEGATWRWTEKHPTVKILLRKTTGWKYVADFALPEATWQQTGPVTLSFYVGQRRLETIRYTMPGSQHYEKAIDPSWLQTSSETEVSVEIDKLYRSPRDGATLGFVLTRLGFESR